VIIMSKFDLWCLKMLCEQVTSGKDLNKSVL